MNAICSICGRDMTVQDREGTAFCLSCENAGLHARIAELEATASGPERDLAEQTLEMLEWLARASWGRAKLKTGLPELTVAWGEGILHYHSQIGGRRPSRGITRADALALLRKKGGKDAG